MATHRQLPNNTDIAPFQEKGRWYRAFIEKDESGNSKLTYADSGLPSINPAGYGFTMDGQKDGKNFHLISVSCNPDVGTGTAGDPAFFYPTIGQTYTESGSQYAVDFNKPETNVSLKINGTSATVTEQVNGLVQKNIDIAASVAATSRGTISYKSGVWDYLSTTLDAVIGDSIDTNNTILAIRGTGYGYNDDRIYLPKSFNIEPITVNYYTYNAKYIYDFACQEISITDSSITITVHTITYSTTNYAYDENGNNIGANGTSEITTSEESTTITLENGTISSVVTETPSISYSGYQVFYYDPVNKN